MVDDRDVAGAEPLDQVLGAAPEPGGAVDRRVGGRSVTTREAERESDGDWRLPSCEVSRPGKRAASGRGQQLARVAGRRLVGALAAEHAADLLDDPLALEPLARSRCARSPATSFSR